jgi:hypothetical protein
LAEKTVQIAKRILDKSKADGKDSNLGFLEYRTTPLNIGYSPSQLLMSRKLRSILPVVPDELRPKVPVRVREMMAAEKGKQKEYYDHSAKPLPPLAVGDSIRYQDKKNLETRNSYLTRGRQIIHCQEYRRSRVPEKQTTFNPIRRSV